MIRCGGSSMSLVFGGTLAPGSPGMLRVRRLGAIGGREPRGASNRAALLTAALPLAIGIGLAVITGMWIFLAFTAVSAVSVLVPVPRAGNSAADCGPPSTRQHVRTGNDDGGPHRPPASCRLRRPSRNPTHWELPPSTGPSGCGSGSPSNGPTSGWNRRIPVSAPPQLG